MVVVEYKKKLPRIPACWRAEHQTLKVYFTEFIISQKLNWTIKKPILASCYSGAY